MNRPGRILAALFLTASILFFAWLIFFVCAFVGPSLPTLRANPRQATIVGSLMGYWTAFALIYAQAARFVWRREQWKRAVFFSALGCFGLPVGPVLGPIAILLLTRPDLRARFTS